jgi:outer membrane protein assembly factor BamE (lipoprotein component of BamABCDE complex)
MIKLLYIIIFSLIVTNCSFKKVVKHHGVSFLEKKEKKLFVNQTNKNDIIKILGSPSTTSKFDNNIWIYIERKQTQSSLKNLGKMKIYENNILVIKISDYGILQSKKLYNKEEMENIDLVTDKTISTYKRDTFIYDFMSSLRQKINDPLGQRAKKRKEISQR